MARRGVGCPFFLVFHILVSSQATCSKGVQRFCCLHQDCILVLFQKKIEGVHLKPPSVQILVWNASPPMSHVEIDKPSKEGFCVIPLSVSSPKMGRPPTTISPSKMGKARVQMSPPIMGRPEKIVVEDPIQNLPLPCQGLHFFVDMPHLGVDVTQFLETYNLFKPYLIPTRQNGKVVSQEYDTRIRNHNF